jgi:hypothetical protein
MNSAAGRRKRHRLKPFLKGLAMHIAILTFEGARREWQQAILLSTLVGSKTKVETSFPADPAFLQGKEHEFMIS